MRVLCTRTARQRIGFLQPRFSRWPGAPRKGKLAHLINKFLLDRARRGLAGGAVQQVGLAGGVKRPTIGRAFGCDSNSEAVNDGSLLSPLGPYICIRRSLRTSLSNVRTSNIRIAREKADHRSPLPRVDRGCRTLVSHDAITSTAQNRDNLGGPEKRKGWRRRSRKDYARQVENESKKGMMETAQGTATTLIP